MTDSSGSVSPIRPAQWGTADSGYDPDEFYCSTRSPDGQSFSMSVTIPAAMASQIGRIVQSGEFPYKTREDMIRDALHHRLHHLDQMGDLGIETRRRIALWRRQEELDRHEAEIEATERLIKETAQMVERARGKGDRVLLEKVVQEAEAAAADLHEPWRQMLLAGIAGERGEE